MTTIIFTPQNINYGEEWSDNTIWSSGAYPNSPTANVYLAPIPEQGYPYLPYSAGIDAGMSISLGSLSIAQSGVIVGGSLTVANAVIVGDGGSIGGGGTLGAASIL